MDIEFIELQHRPAIIQLMDMLKIDMNQAYQLFINNDYNKQRAIHKYFNFNQRMESPVRAGRVPVMDQSFNSDVYGSSIMQENGDSQAREYSKFMNEGVSFDQAYLKNKKRNAGKGNIQNDFVNNLNKILKCKSQLKIQVGSLLQSLQISWKQRFPLLVFVFNFQEETHQHLQQLFADQNLIKKVFNVQFKVCGINSSTYKIEPELKQFISLIGCPNQIVILRVNHMDKIQNVTSIDIDASYQNIITLLRRAKVECIQRQLDQAYIVKQYRMISQGISYQRPHQVKEFINLRKERELKQQQDKDYMRMLKETDQPIKTQLSNSKLKLTREQIQNNRKQLRNQLTIYDDGMSFKVRLPSGKNIILQVQGKEQVQYLFDFIQSYPQKLGFVNQMVRQFDLSTAIGGVGKLNALKSKRIEQIFTQPQTLSVHQIGS